jgi:C-terminal processing protease CtpA/Prc
MQNSNRNRWLEGLIAASLALMLVTTCMAGPPDKERRVEAIVIGEDADPDFLWIEAGSSSFLGVQVEEETESDEGGARVTSVVQDSPAEAAGIEEGDVIVEFDGDTVRGPVSLTTKIHAREPGDEVVIFVRRDGKKMKLEAELGDRAESGARTLTMSFLGELPEDLVLPEFNLEFDEQLKENMERLQDRFVDLHHCEEADEDCSVNVFSFFAGRPTLGVQLVETTPELREHLGGSEEAGVLVSKVLSGTPAREAGIEVGDLIVEIDGEPVSRSSDIRRRLHGKQGASVNVVVIREGARIDIQVALPEADEDMPTGPRASVLPLSSCAPAPAMAPSAIRRVIKMPAAPKVVAPPAPQRPPRRLRRVVLI